MKKAIAITAIIAAVSLLCVIGFAVGAAAQGVPVVLDSIHGRIGNIDIGNLISQAINDEDVRLRFDDFTVKDSDKKTLDFSQVDTVNISVDAAKVIIEKTSGNTAEVLLETGNAIPAKRTLKAEVSGSSAVIESLYHNNGNFDVFNLTHTKVTIRLPEKNYSKIKLVLNAGDFSMEDAVSSNVNLELNAGNVNLNRVQGDDFTVTCNAGNIELENVTGKTLRIENNAGNVEVRDDSRFTDKIDGSVNVGNITLRLPKDIGFELQYKAEMGSISNSFGGEDNGHFDIDNPVSKSGTILYGDESCKITLNAEMGNIDIR